MLDNSDDIDEVALNVLLAEGVDLPTAIEASRSNDASPTGQGCLGVAATFIAATLASAFF